MLEELKKEYESQDNRGTAYPLYVTVQERFCVGVIANGYSVNCPYGDGETVTEYKYNDFEGNFKSVEDLKKCLEFNGELEDFNENDVEEFNVGYIWHPVEFFLTIKGAKEYIKANKHNHGELRTYVGWFENRNFEMRGLLKEIGFRTKD